MVGACIVGVHMMAVAVVVVVVKHWRWWMERSTVVRTSNRFAVADVADAVVVDCTLWLTMMFLPTVGTCMAPRMRMSCQCRWDRDTRRMIDSLVVQVVVHPSHIHAVGHYRTAVDMCTCASMDPYFCC